MCIDYNIRKFQVKDAEEVSKLIFETMTTTNIHDYSMAELEKTIKRFSPEGVIERAKWTHFYVVVYNEEAIIGCGAIGPYWGKEDESALFNIFVLPKCQGLGVGRKIIETLEKDEFFLRAKRIEVASSISAHQFYIKMGYSYKNNIKAIDEEKVYRLEKIR